MAKQGSPWFACYAEKFLGGTAHMNCEEVGIYFRLLCYQWVQNGVPADRVKHLAGTYEKTESFDTVLKKFRAKKGLLFNRRMELVRKERDTFRKKQRDNANQRWASHGHANACAKPHPKTMPLKQSQSQSQLQSNTLIDVKSIDRGSGGKVSPDFIALTLANRILANEFDWDYDNCKVQVQRLKSSSLVTVIRPFVGQVPDLKIFAAWKEAVRIAHGAKVDRLARDATAYAVQCFKDQLNQKLKTTTLP